MQCGIEAGTLLNSAERPGGAVLITATVSATGVLHTTRYEQVLFYKHKAEALI